MELKEYKKYIKLLKDNISQGRLNVPNSFPLALFGDKSFVELALYYIPDNLLLPLVSNKLKEDKDFILFSIKGSRDAFKHFNEDIRDNKEIMLDAVKINGLSLEYASDRLKNDEEVVKLAVSDNGRAFIYSSTNLKNNKDILLLALSNYGSALEYASESLKSDKEVVLTAIKHPYIGNLDGESPLKYASINLRNDKEMILEAVKYSAYAVNDISEELLKNKEFVLSLFKTNSSLYELPNMRKYLNDKDIVLAALSTNGHFNLMDVPNKFLDDKDVVVSAIKNHSHYDPWMLYQKYVSNRLQDDVDVLLCVLETTDKKGYRKTRPIDYKDEDKKESNQRLAGGDFD